jgi:hypothetical protein
MKQDIYLVGMLITLHKNAQIPVICSVSGSKRSRISENTTILSTSDIGNEDDRDSDSGGELRADHTLGKIITRFLKGREHMWIPLISYVIYYINNLTKICSCFIKSKKKRY